MGMIDIFKMVYEVFSVFGKNLGWSILLWIVKFYICIFICISICDYVRG